MKEQRRARGFDSDRDGKLGISARNNDSGESRHALGDGEVFNKDEKRILDALTKGLSREFPNPDRVGCPDSTVLRGIAFRKLRLAEVDQWLDHLSSCSPCYQEFTELRREAASQRRRTQVWFAVAAVLIFTVSGWLWVRAHQQVQPTETAVLDLRGLSVARGENPTQAEQRPLELHRSAKHLILDLPIGSKEGAYDLALLSETGAQLVSATGSARLEDHVIVLRINVGLRDTRPGVYSLALRRLGGDWTQYPVRIV